MPDPIGAAFIGLPPGYTIGEDLAIKRLSAAHAAALFELIQRNRSHLTQHGDYRELVDLDAATLAARLSLDTEAAFGIFLQGELIGTVTLIHYQKGVCGLGYWISSEQTGRGYVGLSCQALIDLARSHLDVREFWAGITHGNEASIAVVSRLGFVLERTQPTHLSYLLRLD